jgi:NAD(P)-dependent dehydrogenase (short-subunit alcohol dehydrogenase family)
VSALRGKTILITGGGSGLGREIALQAAEQGARVALMDVRLDRMATVTAAIGDDSLAIQADITSEEQVVGAVRQAIDRYGQVDVVVNSAGIIARGPMIETSMADYDRMHAVNVRGVYLMSREAAKVMVPRGSGHIFNIASIAGKRGIVDESAYASGKWAVVGLGECMALELGPKGVRVTTICPGGMNTTFWDGDPKNAGSTHMLNPAHVAKAIVQIVSLPPEVVVKEALVYQPGR